MSKFQTDVLTEAETQALSTAIAQMRQEATVREDNVSLTTANNMVAVEPFPTNQVEKEIRHGVAMVRQKHSLQPLKVVFGDNDRYTPGKVVWVRADQCVASWAKEVFEIDSKKFVLLPKDQVVLVGG